MKKKRNHINHILFPVGDNDSFDIVRYTISNINGITSREFIKRVYSKEEANEFIINELR